MGVSKVTWYCGGGHVDDQGRGSRGIFGKVTRCSTRGHGVFQKRLRDVERGVSREVTKIS